MEPPMSRILKVRIRAPHVVCAAALALLLLLTPANAAETNVFLGRARNFAVIAGSSINNTGQTVLTGSIGIAPGTNVVGFARSAVQVNTRAATNAQFDLTRAYNEAAARSNATAFPGTLSVTPGLYRTSALTIPSGG